MRSFAVRPVLCAEAHSKADDDSREQERSEDCAYGDHGGLGGVNRDEMPPHPRALVREHPRRDFFHHRPRIAVTVDHHAFRGCVAARRQVIFRHPIPAAYTATRREANAGDRTPRGLGGVRRGIPRRHNPRYDDHEKPRENNDQKRAAPEDREPQIDGEGGDAGRERRADECRVRAHGQTGRDAQAKKAARFSESHTLTASTASNFHFLFFAFE